MRFVEIFAKMLLFFAEYIQNANISRELYIPTANTRMPGYRAESQVTYFQIFFGEKNCPMTFLHYYSLCVSLC
jgi:hypothetical protein